MSRQELAEALNAHVYQETQRVIRLDSHYIGKLERGVTRWPQADYRQGLRVVLDAPSDAALGLFIVRRSAVDERYAAWYVAQSAVQDQTESMAEVAGWQGISRATLTATGARLYLLQGGG